MAEPRPRPPSPDAAQAAVEEAVNQLAPSGDVSGAMAFNELSAKMATYHAGDKYAGLLTERLLGSLTVQAYMGGELNGFPEVRRMSPAGVPASPFARGFEAWQFLDAFRARAHAVLDGLYDTAVEALASDPATQAVHVTLLKEYTVLTADTADAADANKKLLHDAFDVRLRAWFLMGDMENKPLSALPLLVALFVSKDAAAMLSSYEAEYSASLAPVWQTDDEKGQVLAGLKMIAAAWNRLIDLAAVMDIRKGGLDPAKRPKPDWITKVGDVFNDLDKRNVNGLEKIAPYDTPLVAPALPPALPMPPQPQLSDEDLELADAEDFIQFDEYDQPIFEDGDGGEPMDVQVGQVVQVVPPVVPRGKPWRESIIARDEDAGGLFPSGRRGLLVERRPPLAEKKGMYRKEGHPAKQMVSGRDLLDLDEYHYNPDPKPLRADGSVDDWEGKLLPRANGKPDPRADMPEFNNRYGKQPRSYVDIHSDLEWAYNQRFKEQVAALPLPPSSPPLPPPPP
jgi:hypothetical protein